MALDLLGRRLAQSPATSSSFCFPLQILHFALERRFQIARSAAEFGHRFPDRPPQFWKLLGPKQNEGDDEDDDHLLYANRTHRVPCSFTGTVFAHSRTTDRPDGALCAKIRAYGHHSSDPEHEA